MMARKTRTITVWKDTAMLPVSVMRPIAGMVRKIAPIRTFIEYVDVYDADKWHPALLQLMTGQILRRLRQKTVDEILDLLRQRKSRYRTRQLQYFRKKLEWVMAILSRHSSQRRARARAHELDMQANRRIQETILSRLANLEESIYRGSRRPEIQLEQLRAMTRKIRGDQSLSARVSRRIAALERRSRVG